jgi:hypothetical protein
MICIKTDETFGPGGFTKLAKLRADGGKTESHIVFLSCRAIIYSNNNTYLATAKLQNNWLTTPVKSIK